MRLVCVEDARQPRRLQNSISVDWVISPALSCWLASQFIPTDYCHLYQSIAIPGLPTADDPDVSTGKVGSLYASTVGQPSLTHSYRSVSSNPQTRKSQDSLLDRGPGSAIVFPATRQISIALVRIPTKSDSISIWRFCFSPNTLQTNNDMSNDEIEQTTGSPGSPFIYVICQNGAEAATKLEIMTSHPNLKLAFSRPGFITFKVDPHDPLPERFNLKSTLARTFGWSLGKTSGDEAGAMVAEIAAVPRFEEAKQIHVWQRDPVIPGRNGFEPGVSTLAREIGKLFEQTEPGLKNNLVANRESKPDELVFDVVMVEPSEWWYGYHFANTVAGRWPGGTPLFNTSVETCSRAYFKLKEALLWSGITIQPGDVCAEIGSAPGGACQLLLELGAHVIGIDPAEMDPGILEHENFTHLRRRGNEVKKRDFRDVRWLLADLNVDPNYTLGNVAEIVNHDSIDIKGVILTLKLTDWRMVAEIPELIAETKMLGFQVVKARQLAFNRQEFCLIAVKDKFLLRLGKKARTSASLKK